MHTIIIKNLSLREGNRNALSLQSYMIKAINIYSIIIKHQNLGSSLLLSLKSQHSLNIVSKRCV